MKTIVTKFKSKEESSSAYSGQSQGLQQKIESINIKLGEIE